MPITDPFDVIRSRGRQTAPDVDEDDGSSSVPEDAPTPFSMALQQQRVQAPADLAASEQQQAAQAAAAQKAQQAQDKLDAANQAVQDKVDAANLKASGAVTQDAVAAGPDGRARVIQQQQTNPDGTPAFQAGPMGIKYGPDGTPYDVTRTQWGTQNWSSPYAPANANLKLNSTGQIMATPRGKGAAALPQQDVTMQGVSGDQTGNPADLKVDPTAPINSPQVVPEINAEEQKLVQQAAAQRVKDTVGKDADDAAQALADARSDHTDAQSALAEAKANMKTADDPDAAQKQLAAAQQVANQKQQALLAAGKDAAAKRNLHQQAQADPLGFLQSQQAPPNQPISGAAQPPDTGAAAVAPQPGVSSPTAQQPVTSPAAGAAPAPSQPPPDPTTATDPTGELKIAGMSLDPSIDPTAAPDAGALNLDSAGNVSVANPIAIPRVPSMKEMVGTVLKSAMGNITSGTGDVIKGVAHASRYINPAAYADAITKSFMTPEQAQAYQARQLNVTDAAEGIGTWFQKGGENYNDKSVAPDLKDDPLVNFFGGGARFIPSMVTGPYAMVAGSAQMAQQFKDGAAANGRTPAQQEAAFGIGALTGAVLNKTVGMIPILHEAADSPALLKVLASDGVTSDVLKSFGKGIARTGLEGFGMTAAGQLAEGGDNTLEGDAKGSLQMLPFALLGPAFRGLGLRDASRKVDQNLAKVNADLPPEQQVSRGDYLTSLVQQNQYVQAQRAVSLVQKQFSNIDSNTGLSPDQVARAKAAAVAKLPADIRPTIQLHLDDAADAQRQVNQALAPFDAAEKKLPPADPKLAKLSDAALQTSIQSGVADPSMSAELDRRQQVAALDQQRQQVIGQVNDRLRSSMVAGNELARTPEGRQAMQSINDYNASQPAGAPMADALTAQKASDLAPKTAEVNVQPTLGHYLPVSHAIEQLADPDQQAMATAALKLTNGRALTDDERMLLLGAPDGSQPAAVTPTGQPYAKVEGQRPILTDAGLARLRNLVPQASDILPKSEQAQLEAQPPPAETKGAKSGTKQPQGETKPPVSQPPPLPSAPDPGLAQVDDESLRVRHESVSAAIAKAKATGGDSPASVYAHRDRLATEIARRQAAIAPAAANPLGAVSGAKEGDEIDYTRPNHEGQPVATRGEVTEVHPDHYRVVDTHDGVERTVPIHANEAVPKPEEPGQVAGKPNKTGGDAPGNGDGAKAKTTGEINLPGLDTAKIAPEHQEAAKLLSDAYSRMKPLFDALGLDPSAVFSPKQGAKGTAGLGISPADPTKILVDLPLLSKNLARLNTPGKRKLRLDAVMEEEAIHLAGEKVLGRSSDAVHDAIWKSLTKEQQDKVIAEYGPHLERPADGKDDGLDANRGREYIRMLVQLERSGRTTEWSNKLSGKTVEYLRKVVDYLKSILKPGHPAVSDLVKRIQNILDKGSDEDQLDMSPPNDEPPVPKMSLPARMSDEEIAAQEAAHKELMGMAFGDRDTLLDTVKKLGGIPTTDPALQGELQNVKEGKNKGMMMQLFRKSALTLHKLREGLSEKGFHFDTEAEMLDGILNSVRTGKPIYGPEVDQLHSNRLDRQTEAVGKPAHKLSPAEKWAVTQSAKRISGAADDLRKAVSASGIEDETPHYPGPLPMPGMPPGDLSPEQRAVEAKFGSWVQEDPARAARAYAELPETEGGRVIDMDEARKLSPDYNASKHAKTIHSVSVQKVVNALATRKLLVDASEGLRPGDTMGLTAGGPGSGKGNIKKVLSAEWNGAKFVYDGVLRGMPFAEDLIKGAKSAGAKTKIWYVHVPVEKAVEQAVGRAEYDGRSLPINVLASGHYQAQRTAIALLQKYAGDPDVEIKVVDNSGPQAQVVNQPLSFLQNERILYRDEDEAQQRAQQAFEDNAHRLTDPDAVSIFRNGKTLAQLAAHSGAGTEGRGRRVGQGDGTTAATGPAGESSSASLDSPRSSDGSPSSPVVGGAAIADSPDIEEPLTRYVSALHQGQLGLDQPGQLDFSREYQTDIGKPAPPALVARAKEMDVQPGEADQAVGSTPEELFNNHLDIADRLAKSFDNIPGFQPDDARQVARLALQKAAEKYTPDHGVPFRGYAPGIIRNALRDAYRAQDRRAVEQPTLDRPVDAANSDVTGKDLVRAKEPTAAEAVARKDVHGQLRDYIGRVSMAPESRKALTSLLDGRDQNEIAQDLKVSPQRVSAMVGSGLEQLRKVFAEKGITRDDMVGGSAIRDQTETPEFKRWFGDSKMVDADGKPSVLYHGSKVGGLDEFNLDKQISHRRGVDRGPAGFYFGDKDTATNFSVDHDTNTPHPENVHPVHLKIERPFTNREKLTGKLWSDFVQAFPEVKASPLYQMDSGNVREGLKDGWANGATLNNVFEHLNADAPFGSEPTFEKSVDLRKRYTAFLKAHGYDGFNFNNNTGVVAFDPSQVKSATRNRGTFDPNDARITHGAAVPESEELPGGERITPEDLAIDHDGNSWNEAKDNYDPDEPSTWPFAKSEDLDTYKTELDAFDKNDPDTWDAFLPMSLAGEHGGVTELADDTAAIADRLEAQEGVNPALAKKARQLADEVRSQVDQTIKPVAEKNADYVRGILDQAQAKAEDYFKDSDDPDVKLARMDIDQPEEWPQSWRDEYEQSRREAGIPDGGYDHPKLSEVNDAFDAKHKPEIDAAKARVAARDAKPEQGTLFGGAVKEDPHAFTRDALGFKPLALGEHAPKLEAVAQAFKGFGDGLMKPWAPHLRGDEAAWTARSLSANLGEAALKHYRDQVALESASKLFARKSLGESLAFIDAIEKGTPIADPALNEIAKKLRAVNDQKVEAARAIPSKQFKGFIENYFPHIWKHSDLEKAQAFYRNKIEGSRAFLKHRSIPTIADGIKAGLQLDSHNPVDLFLKRWGQMDKFVAAQKMINEGKEAGLFKEFKNDKDILPGYARIDPKIGYSSEEVPDTDAIEENRQARENPELFPTNRQPKRETMQRFVPLYAPEQAADVLNNYLSPGLRNHPNPAVSGSFKALMGAGNLLNSAQLGLSAFHLGFTTTDTMVSKLGLALEQFEQGQGVKGLKSLGSLPATPFTNLLQGHKLLAELQHPGTQGPEMAALADMVTAGGGRAGLDPVYSDQWVKGFMNAIHSHDVLGTLGRAPFAGVEALGIPIMKWLVPRQKLGVFADLAKHEMGKLGPNATQDDVRKAMQSAWASVDNRMGQLVYDNLHWNKAAKDAAMVGMRSVGWNIGTVRELGGGYIDSAKYIANKVRGKDAEFTHKMAYTMALHLLLGGMGTLTGYLLTGKGPESVVDAFFPKTGFKDANGHDARIAFPSYVKDEASYLHAPVQTLENKANPLLSVLFSLYNNKDYYGTQIRNPDDPAYRQLLDTAGFAGKEMLPFSIQGGNKFSQATPPALADQGPLTRALGTGTTHALLDAGPTVGLTPAAAYLSTSAAEQRAQDLEERLHSGDTHDKDEAASYQKYLALRNQFAQNDPIEKGITPEEQVRRQKLMAAAFQQATKDGTLQPGGVGKLIEAARKPPLQRMFEGITKEFQMKGDSKNAYLQAKSIWDLATPAERKLLAPKMSQVWGTARTKKETTDPNPVSSGDKK